MSLNDYCENIRKAVVELSIPFQDVEINITISGGVINSSEVKDQEELVNLADERLYKAKEGEEISLFIAEGESYEKDSLR